ncbi:hypothetical protein HYV31_03845 [candidate division WWE3 bacterium]|nr:hypothetical protein [candidate division WWE3 bacterium]
MQKKKLRTKRYEEILKAQGSVGLEIEAKGGSERKNINDLPIKQIKSDLIKTSIFAVFSLLFILALHFNGIGYKEITALLQPR